MLRSGEAAIGNLAVRAGEVQALITANFPAKSLADVQTAFEGAGVSGAPNAEVLKVGALVREQAAAAIEDFKAA